MNIRHEQIVGIIDNDNNIDYKICRFDNPITHNQEWKNIKKSWRIMRKRNTKKLYLYNSINSLEELTDKEKNAIKELIEKKMNIKVEI